MSHSSSDFNETERDIQTFGQPDLVLPDNLTIDDLYTVNNPKKESSKANKTKRVSKHRLRKQTARSHLCMKILAEMNWYQPTNNSLNEQTFQTHGKETSKTKSNTDKKEPVNETDILSQDFMQMTF